MPIQTAKSHKSQKAGEPAKPRQRNIAGVIAIPATEVGTSVTGSSRVVSPSSDNTAATASVPPVDVIPARPSWWRAPDSKLRKQSEKIAVMRAANHPVGEIAKRLKTSEPNVRFVEYVARKNGWYDENDESVDVEAELAFDIDRKVVRNISQSLDGEMTNWQTHEMTLAAARGRGMFKTHEKSESQQQILQVVAIRIEMPAIGAGDQSILEGSIGGVPAYREGEAEDVRPLQRRLVGGDTQETDAGTIQSEPDAIPRGL